MFFAYLEVPSIDFRAGIVSHFLDLRSQLRVLRFEVSLVLDFS